MQYRHIYYSFLGFDQNLNNVQQSVKFDFFNPKVGLTYQLNANSNVYASFAVGNHGFPTSAATLWEFISTKSGRKAENFSDLEVG